MSSLNALFIAGTGTDVGKTYVAVALVRALRARGVAIDVLKPVISGFDESAPETSDTALLLAAMGEAVTTAAIGRVSPWRYRAPLAPDEAARIEARTLDGPAVIELCLTRMAQSSGRLLVIEAAGGIMSPLDETHTMLDLVQALRVPMLLVAGSYLGTISHTLTAAAVIAASAADLKAVVVSESSEGPAMGATLAALRRRLTVPVAAVTRGGAIPEGLVEEIAD